MRHHHAITRLTRLTRLTSLALGALAWVGAPNAAGAQIRDLGVNVHLDAPLGPPIAASAGLGWVRADFNWNVGEVAPGAYDWTAFDAVVDAAEARGLRVLAVVGYGPPWSSEGDTLGDGSHNDVPVAGAYEVFLAEVVARYADRISHWELWNEPNLGDFFEGTVEDYTSRVLGPGAAAVRAACPGCRVVAPGLASVGGAHEPWLRAILASHADDIDVVSGHIYSPFEEDAPGAGETSDSFTNRLDDHRVLTLPDGTVAFEGPLSFKELMDEAGVDKPFWLTETGLEADASDGEALERQRVYTRRVLEKMLSRPWWEATIFYEAFDNSELDWGLATPDAAAPEGFADKPVMDLLRTVTSEQPLFGGDGADCSDGLDNEGDGLVDFPDDEACASADGTSEGPPPQPEGSGGGGSSGGGSPQGGGGTGGAGEGDEDGPAAGGTMPEPDGGCACRLEARPRGGEGRGGGGALAFTGALLAGAIARRCNRCTSDADRRALTPSRGMGDPPGASYRGRP